MPDRRMLSYENSFRTPWAESWNVGMLDSIRIRTPPNIPTFQRFFLVELLNFRPREIGTENLLMVLPRPGSADRPPLTPAAGVPGAGPRRDDARDFAVRLRDGQLKCQAVELAIRLGPQHRSHVGARNADVATLEHDAHLADAPRPRGAAHGEVRDALHAVTRERRHAGQRSRQYSAELLTVPFFAPAKSRGDVTVVMAAAAIVGNRPQIRPGASGRERLVDARGAESAGLVEVGVDHCALVAHDLSSRLAGGIPHLPRLV